MSNSKCFGYFHACVLYQSAVERNVGVFDFYALTSHFKTNEFVPTAIDLRLRNGI